MTVVFATGGLAALQLESLVDPAPAALPPRVRVTVTDVASTLTFTLTRLCEGESWTVPGWRARTFTDSDVDVDWVAPLNRPVTYTLSADGVAICTATIILESETAIIQDPIQPEKFVPVELRRLVSGALTLEQGAIGSLTYESAGTSIPVMGSRYGVSIGGQRQAAAGVPLGMLAPDEATSDSFRAVLAEAPILVYRPVAKSPLPAVSYLRASPVEVPVGEDGFTQWQVSGDLVSAVVQAAISGFVTYDQVQQLLAGVTYDEVQAAYAGLTYLDVQKDPLVYSTL